MTKHFMVINSGSSSIKFAVFEYHATFKKSLYGHLENIKTAPRLKIYHPDNSLIEQRGFSQDLDYDDYFKLLISSFASNRFNYTISGVGHRVVHGGTRYQQPILITQSSIEALKTLIPFAPLHQPYNLKAIESIYKLYPNLTQVACFDTAFHRTHPAVADQFGLPRFLSEAGIRRYGFHGLSYEYIIHKLREINPAKAQARLVVAHLGNGASMCAIKEGKAVDSTMGFTALDGLVMGTRCGTLDPGIPLFLLQSKNMSCQEIESMFYKQSGLLGVSGITHNMQQLLKNDTASAKEAIELFVYRIRRELGALTAILGGLDMIIFTGGIGEHAWQIREKVCVEQDWLGLTINPELNKKNARLISAPQSRIEVLVLPTDEEWIIAKHTHRFINKDS